MCKVQQCVQLLSRAKKPVMLIGSQATLPPCPVDKLATAVEVRILFFLLSVNMIPRELKNSNEK